MASFVPFVSYSVTNGMTLFEVHTDTVICAEPAGSSNSGDFPAPRPATVTFPLSVAMTGLPGTSADASGTPLLAVGDPAAADPTGSEPVKPGGALGSHATRTMAIATPPATSHRARRTAGRSRTTGLLTPSPRFRGPWIDGVPEAVADEVHSEDRARDHDRGRDPLPGQLGQHDRADGLRDEVAPAGFGWPDT